MLQLALLISAIYMAVSLPKRRKRKAEDYPGVELEKFDAWHEADLKYVKKFLWIVSGAIVIQSAVYLLGMFIVGVLLPKATWGTADKSLKFATFILFLVSIGWIINISRNVMSLKRDAGIT